MGHSMQKFNLRELFCNRNDIYYSAFTVVSMVDDAQQILKIPIEKGKKCVMTEQPYKGLSRYLMVILSASSIC